MRRFMWAALCLVIPGLLFLNAWEGFRYSDLADRVQELEKEQRVLLEENRDAIAQIAYESSPERVAEKAAGLGLAAPDQADVTRLQVEPTSAEGRTQ